MQGAAPAADVSQLPLRAGHVGAADGKVRNKPLAYKPGEAGVGSVPEVPAGTVTVCSNTPAALAPYRNRLSFEQCCFKSVLGYDVIWPVWGVFLLSSLW